MLNPRPWKHSTELQSNGAQVLKQSNKYKWYHNRTRQTDWAYQGWPWNVVLPNFSQVPVTLIFYQPKHLYKVRKNVYYSFHTSQIDLSISKPWKESKVKKRNLFFAKIKLKGIIIPPSLSLSLCILGVQLFQYCFDTPSMHISKTEDFLLYHTNPTFNPLRKLNIFHSSAMSVAKLTSVSKTITCGKKNYIGANLSLIHNLRAIQTLPLSLSKFYK